MHPGGAGAGWAEIGISKKSGLKLIEQCPTIETVVVCLRTKQSTPHLSDAVSLVHQIRHVLVLLGSFWDSDCYTVDLSVHQRLAVLGCHSKTMNSVVADDYAVGPIPLGTILVAQSACLLF